MVAHNQLFSNGFILKKADFHLYMSICITLWFPKSAPQIPLKKNTTT